MALSSRSNQENRFYTLPGHHDKAGSFHREDGGVGPESIRVGELVLHTEKQSLYTVHVYALIVNKKLEG